MYHLPDLDTYHNPHIPAHPSQPHFKHKNSHSNPTLHQQITSQHSIFRTIQTLLTLVLHLMCSTLTHLQDTTRSQYSHYSLHSLLPPTMGIRSKTHGKDKNSQQKIQLSNLKSVVTLPLIDIRNIHRPYTTNTRLHIANL